jgi:hypothetical protein
MLLIDLSHSSALHPSIHHCFQGKVRTAFMKLLFGLDGWNKKGIIRFLIHILFYILRLRLSCVRVCIERQIEEKGQSSLLSCARVKIKCISVSAYYVYDYYYYCMCMVSFLQYYSVHKSCGLCVEMDFKGLKQKSIILNPNLVLVLSTPLRLLHTQYSYFSSV